MCSSFAIFSFGLTFSIKVTLFRNLLSRCILCKLTDKNETLKGILSFVSKAYFSFRNDKTGNIGPVAKFYFAQLKIHLRSFLTPRCFIRGVTVKDKLAICILIAPVWALQSFKPLILCIWVLQIPHRRYFRIF